MKYYLIAGEASGDLHGANLIKALREADPAAEIRGWGGDLMAAAGMTLVKHYRDLAFMGFVEVVKNLPTILGNLSFCKKDIAAFGPDRLVFIDYPGFNLRVAKWARPAGYDITYYISPQVWAWHTSRVKQIRANVDRMLVILPFEEAFFAKHGVASTFVGHPLLDALPNVADRTDRERSHTIALLPGSRTQEIKTSLPIMLAAAANFPEYRFVIAAAPGQDRSFYEGIVAATGQAAEIRSGETYAVLSEAHAALVTSGTATLETALFGVPEVVCYRGNAVSYAIARRLVASRIKFISLVNLIMDREVVPELIQAEFNAGSVTEALKKIVAGPGRDRQLAELALLRERLGSGGASRRAADLIVRDY